MPTSKRKAKPPTMTEAGLRKKLWAVIAEARRSELDDTHIEEVLLSVGNEFSHPDT